MEIKLTGQRGFAMIEVIGAMAIMGVVIVGLAQMSNNYIDDAKNQVTAHHARQVLNCGKTWIKDNYATVTATATAVVTYNLPVSTLVASGCLPSGFSAVNSYGQTLEIRALEPVANQVQAILISTGGTAINDFDLGTIATAIGSEGGSVRTATSTTLTGAFGSYAIPLAGYGVAPGAGHIGGAIWFDANGAALSDYLYRAAVPGHPEANTMSTPLIMSAVQAINTACTTTGSIARDGSGKVISCQGGLWKASSGSAYWGDPVATFATLPACNAASQWQTRVAQTPTVGSGPRAYTCNGATWVAVGVDDNGNFSAPGNLTASGTVTGASGVTTGLSATIGAACAGTGTIAKDMAGTGLILSCQSGVWASVSVVSGTQAGTCNFSNTPTYPALSCVPWACGFAFAWTCWGINTCAPGWTRRLVGGDPWDAAYTYACVKD